MDTNIYTVYIYQRNAPANSSMRLASLAIIIPSTSNDIYIDEAAAKTGGHKGNRGDRRFHGRGGYSMETSYHYIHQNTENTTQWRCVTTIYTRILRTLPNGDVLPLYTPEY